MLPTSPTLPQSPTAPQPYVGLCVIFRDNADTLPALLASVRGHFDHYSFTDTGATDGSRALVEAFLQESPGVLTNFTWIDDFAAARNFNFAQSPARWRMFLDSDDTLVRGENVRKILLRAEAAYPQVEAFFIKYEYDRLEELPTMRLCRWRDGWRFVDAIHERLEFAFPSGFRDDLPQASFGHTGEFIIQHKPKTPEEKTSAIRRNAIIAKREFSTATDPLYRARLQRTLAMELKMDGKVVEAIPMWEELYSRYKSYPEGRQAAADICKAHQFAAEEMPAEEKSAALAKAMEWARKAGPAYEGLVHSAKADYTNVLKAAQRSSGTGQQTTHEGYVFEKGAIYVAAADAAKELGLPPDVIEHLINYIPAKLRNDPAIVAHVNGIRAHINRITILVPGTPQPFDENGGGGMLGGSEEAVMYLARELALLGRNVRVFGVLPPHRIPGPDKYGVDWQSYETFNVDNECGTLVLWRAPGLLLKLMQEASNRGGPLTGVLQAYLWLHDSGLGVAPEHAKLLGRGCNGAITLSAFHDRVIREAGYEGESFQLSNGIVEEDFEPHIDAGSFDLTTFGGERDPFSVVYSSCPSRGLATLLRLWPIVKENVPQAHLDIYYDWSMLEQMQPQKYDEIVALYESVRHLDVIHHGGVDHATLHAALRKANVWAYSHFESPMVETFCISAVKAQAAGATVLTVPNGALREVTAGDAYFVDTPDEYLRNLIRLLGAPRGIEYRRLVAHEAVRRYGWKSVAKRFSDLWSLKKPAPVDGAASVTKVEA